MWVHYILWCDKWFIPLIFCSRKIYLGQYFVILPILNIQNHLFHIFKFNIIYLNIFFRYIYSFFTAIRMMFLSFCLIQINIYQINILTKYWEVYNVLQSASLKPCNCTQRFMIIGLINGSIVILTMFLKFKMSKQQQEKHVSKCTLVLNTCSICNLRRLA